MFFYKSKKAKAFTLAEIIVVLAVFGILTMILLPAALHSMPDKKLIKFKKANDVLLNVINELITSGKFYKLGDLGKMPDGSNVSSATYLCNTMADSMNTKKVNCSTYRNGSEEKPEHYHLIWKFSAEDPTEGQPEISLDKHCKTYAPSVGEEIVTNDGTVYYQTNPAGHFASNYKNIVGGLFYYHGCSGTYAAQCEAADIPKDSITVYKIFCIDIDGIHKNATSENCENECPFGYGIRVDGKIIMGGRAKEWLQKGLNGEEEEE